MLSRSGEPVDFDERSPFARSRDVGDYSAVVVPASKNNTDIKIRLTHFEGHLVSGLRVLRKSRR